MKTDPKTTEAAAAPTQPGRPFKALLAKAPLPSPRGPVTAKLTQPPGLAMLKPAHLGGSLEASLNSTVQVARSQAQAHGQALVAQTRGTNQSEAGRLNSVRSDAQAHVQQLIASRTETVQLTRAQVNERAVELIANELVAAFSGVGSRAANDQGKASRRPGVPLPAMDSSRGPTRSDSGEGRFGEADPGTDVQTKAAQAVALIEKIETFVKTNHRPALALTLNNSLGARVEIERIGPGEVALKLVGHRGPPSPEAVSRIREELHARGLKVAALSVA